VATAAKRTQQSCQSETEHRHCERKDDEEPGPLHESILTGRSTRRGAPLAGTVGHFGISGASSRFLWVYASLVNPDSNARLSWAPQRWPSANTASEQTNTPCCGMFDQTPSTAMNRAEAVESAIQLTLAIGGYLTLS
jgi:hypothetical protein